MKRVKLVKIAKKVSDDKRELNREKLRNIQPVKIEKTVLRRAVTVNGLNRVVTTNSLFKTRKNYATLSPQEKREYISTLSKEFISSAGDLLESLKDK